MQRPAPRARAGAQTISPSPEAPGVQAKGSWGSVAPCPHSTEAGLVLNNNSSQGSREDGLVADLSLHLVLATYLPGDFRRVMNL